MRRQTALVLTSLTFFGTFAHAEGCFEKHLHDALKINQERRELYSRASQGASERVSDMLMGLEKRMLAYQQVVDYDNWAAPYEEKGVHIACDAFVPMNGVPVFRTQFAEGPVVAGDGASAARADDLLKLWSAFTEPDEKLLIDQTKRILTRLEQEPRVDCLYRHFLESILRIASLVPKQEQLAKKARLESPHWISREMIMGHLVLLPTVLIIDRQAHDLNVAGLPIICNDVPRIPVTDEELPRPVTNP